MARAAVIGGGAFGTAMACVVRRAGNETTLWAREPEVVEGVNRDGVNAAFLPGVKLEPGIRAALDRVLTEVRGWEILDAHGLAPTRRLLLCGPSGCGKTASAEALAAELKEEGVTANVVLPASIDHPVNRARMPKVDPHTWVAPEELGSLILYLSSEESSGVTGAAIPVTARI